MTKIDIFSGFLGAGKTTLIKKLVAECFPGEQIVIIENEFGEIGIDGAFLKDAGIQVTEMNSGCICCSLVGDFSKALRQVVETYHPARIIIEPSGVGKLSDVAAAVLRNNESDLEIVGMAAVVDANKCKVYSKNFGEFYLNQIESATAVILSRTQDITEEKLRFALSLIREHNPTATVVTTPWDALSGKQILEVIEKRDTLSAALEELKCSINDDDDDDECDDPDCECHHHHHNEDDGDEHHHHHGEHHHHHDDDDDECDDPDCECHHHHHDEDGEDEHEHRHDDDDECDDPDCECHHHHHHHDHHADEVFTSWGCETACLFRTNQVTDKLAALDDSDRFGSVLRAKGLVPGINGWIYFDYVPGECDIRTGEPAVTGRLCVIGSKLNETELKKLFEE